MATDSCSAGGCGTGGWSGPLPGDPSEVFGLTATPAFGGIQLAWNLPGINPYAVAYYTVYRAFSSNFNEAVVRTQVNATGWFDQTALGDAQATKYYWVRVTSVNGTEGDLVGPASAVARPTIQQTLEMLSGMIDDGVLAQSLKEKINHIALLDLDLQAEINARLEANVALQQALAAVSTTVGEQATLITQETTARRNADEAFVGSLDILAAGMNENSAAIVEERDARVTADDALAQQITTLISRTDNNEAAIINESTARTTAIDAAVQAILQLIAENASGTGATSAEVQAEALARANADTALGQRIDTLTAKVGTDISAAIQNYSSAQAQVDQAQANQITQLQAVVGSGANLLTNSSFELDANNDGLAAGWSIFSSSASGSLSAVTHTLITDRFVHGTRAQKLAATMGSTADRIGLYQDIAVSANAIGKKMSLSANFAGTNGGRVRVQITAINSSEVSIDSNASDYTLTAPNNFIRGTAFIGSLPANTVKVRAHVLLSNLTGAAELVADAIQMQFGEATSYAPSPDTTILKTETQARIDGDAALAQAITTAQTTAQNNLASVQQTLQTNINTVNGKVTDIGARWTVQVDVNGLAGGFGVYNNGQSIQAGFDVDYFWVGKTSKKVKPFIITGGEVFINKAVIGTLTADMIDTRGLSIRDTSGNVILAAGSTVATSSINLPGTVNNVPTGWLNSSITVNSAGVLQGVGTSGVTVDNRAVTYGQNLIPNSDQTSSITWNKVANGYNPNGATFDYDTQWADLIWSTNYGLKSGTTRAVVIHQSNRVNGGSSAAAIDMYPMGAWANSIPVVVGQKYCLSCYVQAHRCGVNLGFYWHDAAGNALSSGNVESSLWMSAGGLADSLSAMTRLFAVGTAPAGAVTARLFVRKYNTADQGPYNPSNVTESWMWLAAPQFEAIGSLATGPSPYVAGPASTVRQLGYTGALDATKGATIGQDLAGQFTQATWDLVMQSALIGNAHIAGDIWSSNWAADGSAGWRIFRSGNIVCNNIKARGDIEATTIKGKIVNTDNVADKAITDNVAVTVSSNIPQVTPSMSSSGGYGSVSLNIPAGSRVVVLLKASLSMMSIATGTWSGYVYLRVNGTRTFSIVTCTINGTATRVTGSASDSNFLFFDSLSGQTTFDFETYSPGNATATTNSVSLVAFVMKK